MNFIAINAARAEDAKERFNSLPGKIFGDVKVIGFADSNKSGVKRVLVRCRCGNEYALTEIYLRKIHETRCMRCSQIIKNRGREGYEDFLKNEIKWSTQKTPDDGFRKLRGELYGN